MLSEKNCIIISLLSCMPVLIMEGLKICINILFIFRIKFNVWLKVGLKYVWRITYM